MTSVKDMHRATTIEADDPYPMARKEFAAMARAADESLTPVAAGIDPVGRQAVRHALSLEGLLRFELPPVLRTLDLRSPLIIKKDVLHD